jgi:hypothetical protein
MAEHLLKIVSHYPGRLRVRAEPFRQPALGGEVAEKLRAEAGVESALVSNLTGSLLIEYRAREVQLPRLVQIIMRLGGLDGIAADRGAPPPLQGPLVRDALGGWNESLLDVTRGRLDARTAVPGTLAGLGLLTLLFGNRRLPEWYDLLFWSFVTFVNLNPPRENAPDVPRR